MSTITSSRPIPQRGAVPQLRMAKSAMLASSIDPIRVLRRHIVGIVISAFIGAGLGTAAYFVLNRVYPLYTSEARFEVQPGLQKASQIGVSDLTDDNMVFRIAETETYMLTSHEVLDAALRNPELKQTDWYKYYVKTDSSGATTFDSDEALADLQDEIRAYPIRSSNLFTIQWAAHKPEDARTVLNAITLAYINNRSERDNRVFRINERLFKDQMKTTEDDLKAVASDMMELIKSGRMTIVDEQRYSAQNVRMQELTKQLGDVTSYYSVAQTNAELARQKLDGKIEPTAQDVLEAEHDPAVMEQLSYLERLKANMRFLLATRNPGDNMVTETDAVIKATENQRDAKTKEIINRNIDAKLHQYKDDVERYRNASEEIEKQLETNRVKLEDLTQTQSNYEALKARREHLELQRTADLQLINEVTLMKLRADASRVAQVQQALKPREPSFPKPEIIIPLGVLLMMGLTVGVVFLRELMDQRVKSASDLAVLPGAHVLGSVPDLADDPTKTAAAELVVRKHPYSVLAESYRQAATAMLPMMDLNGHQSLLLVGGLPGSGTTTVATNLAAAAALAGKKVVVIDANFRRPRLAEAMGVSGDGMGLADLLHGAATIDQAVVDAGEGIHVIPAGSHANRVFDRVNNGAFDGMVAELRGRYDLIIFDAPPAVVCGDALILANKVDAAVLVVRAHQEHRGLVARMVHRLSDARSELLGVLLNRPRGIAGGYLKKNYATMAGYGTNAA